MHAQEPDGARIAYWYRNEIEAWLEYGRNGSLPWRRRKRVEPAREVTEVVPRLEASQPPARAITPREQRLREKQHPVTPAGLELTRLAINGQPVYRHIESGWLVAKVDYPATPEATSAGSGETVRGVH